MKNKVCPLYEGKTHNYCASPVCAPLEDCKGTFTGGKCTVPAFIWRKLVTEVPEFKERLILRLRREECSQK